MSLQGPIVIVADRPNADLHAWLTAAGAAQIETSEWAHAANAIQKSWPSLVIIDDSKKLPALGLAAPQQRRGLPDVDNDARQSQPQRGTQRPEERRALCGVR